MQNAVVWREFYVHQRMMPHCSPDYSQTRTTRHASGISALISQPAYRAFQLGNCRYSKLALRLVISKTSGTRSYTVASAARVVTNCAARESYTKFGLLLQKGQTASLRVRARKGRHSLAPRVFIIVESSNNLSTRVLLGTLFNRL